MKRLSENTIALREMAPRKMAHVCEVELEEYMQQQGIDAAWWALAGPKTLLGKDV